MKNQKSKILSERIANALRAWREDDSDTRTAAEVIEESGQLAKIIEIAEEGISSACLMYADQKGGCGCFREITFVAGREVITKQDICDSHKMQCDLADIFLLNASSDRIPGHKEDAP